MPIGRTHRLLTWFVCMTILAPLGMAQSQPATPQPPAPTITTVVTVTAQPMPLSVVPGSVTVLSRDYIESSKADNAADLLRSAPFLDFAQTGASGGFTTITIRGGKPNFTLVMIDGIPVNDITNLLGGSFDLSSLPIDDIERVEIVRGPLSSVYGSDAIAGVINFISRKGEDKPTVEVSGESGNFLRRQIKAGAAGSWKALRYSASGSRLDVGQQVLDDGFSVGSLALNGNLRLGTNEGLDFSVRWWDDKNSGFPTGSGGPEFALDRQPESDHSKELLLGAAFKGQARPWWTYGVNVDRIERWDNNATPAIYDTIPPSFNTQPSSTSTTDFARTRFGANSLFLLPEHLVFALNAGLRYESGSTVGFLEQTIPQSFSLDRTTFLGSSELEYSTNSLTATAGASFDKTKGYGEVTSPRLGVNWLSSKGGPRLKASWAKGFKLPSFYSLGNPSVGNPSLRPERAISFDAGIEQPITRATLSATYFRNDFKDLVDFSSQIFRLVNLSAAIVQGAEVGADYAVTKKIRAGLNFTYMTWSVQNAAEPLRDIPHGDGGGYLDWKFSARFRARAETQWMGRRYDYEVPVPNIPSVGGYSNTNLSANYTVNPKFSVYLRGDNLLNSKYHEYIGFPSPGASIKFGVQFHSRQ